MFVDKSEKINTNIARETSQIPGSLVFLQWRGEDYWLKGRSCSAFSATALNNEIFIPLEKNS